MDAGAPKENQGQPDSQIVELSPDEWEQLRDLKLRSLSEEPVAFEDPAEGAEKYLERSEQEWRDILAGKMSGGRVGETEMVFAKAAGKLVGMVSSIIPSGQDPSLKAATIQHMYVSKSQRGAGLGRKLLVALIAKLRARGDLKKLELEVIASQVPAVELYKSCGFVEVGRKDKAIQRAGGVHDEIAMELKLTDQ